MMIEVIKMKTMEQILNSIQENIDYFEVRTEEADEYNDERDVMKCNGHYLI